MSAIVSRWLLEIKGVKRKLMDNFYIRNGMRVFTVIVLGISLYDIIYLLSFCQSDYNYNDKLKYILIADWISFAVVFIFYIILPLYKVSFIGMGAIPLYFFLIIELECNIIIYEFPRINALYLNI